MKPRILILTAGFGEGHNAAAHALRTACDAVHGEGAAEVIDVFALAAPRINEVVRRSYLGLINRAPRLWSAAYAWLDRSPLAPPLMRSLRRETRVLAEVIGRQKPDVICSTYPAYAFMLEALAKAGRVAAPAFTIVTDSISINSLWWRAGADGWFLPNEDSAEVMRQAGVDPRRLHVLGFPVQPFFAGHAGRLAPPPLASGAAPRVLYIINSGTRAAAETARQLITRSGWDLTCTVGRNEKLRAELERLAAGRPHPTSVLGWTNEIPRLLMTHHVVISKAGGATTQEALAARCPMIVNQVVPGQEDGNWELLRRHGVGALAETPDAVLRELERAFRDRGRVWGEWRAALAPLSRATAAAEIAATLTRHLHHPAGPEPIPMPLRALAASA
jgi:processive 1,2-diacylglycerol beta-glucosyltransferase